MISLRQRPTGNVPPSRDERDHVRSTFAVAGDYGDLSHLRIHHLIPCTSLCRCCKCDLFLQQHFDRRWFVERGTPSSSSSRLASGLGRLQASLPLGAKSTTCTAPLHGPCLPPATPRQLPTYSVAKAFARRIEQRQDERGWSDLHRVCVWSHLYLLGPVPADLSLFAQTRPSRRRRGGSTTAKAKKTASQPAKLAW